ncbi:DUF4097 family beta strand repeat protein [Actinospica durhamensis]|uniref:DUF4097 family beta strand repeat protein n=1 Tax=Actinospica durhamensis TaxID=1508375 RepID=A0A941EVM0_9ACTN|nr:DUF4097 family beta strand repeat-containing protein [Actinospica durhamensis]MBR7837202.1 DUF4097 family beta strand repeat protein [Actinospica durhamensis]
MATDNATEQGQGTASAPAAPAVTRTRAKPLLASAAIVFGLGVTAMIWHATSHPAPGAASASHGADGVKLVELDGFNGKLTVAADGSAQIAATAQPVDGDQAPGLEFHLNAATHVLTLACYDRDGGQDPIPCPADAYAVSLPSGVGLTLNKFSGQADLADLSGPVALTASSVDINAVGLKTADFTAAVTSGTLNAVFATAPTAVDVSISSAQATLHLPGTVEYTVQQQVTSGYVGVSIPQAAGATPGAGATPTPSATDTTGATNPTGTATATTAAHTVLAKVNSGEISLVTN